MQDNIQLGHPNDASRRAPCFNYELVDLHQLPVDHWSNGTKTRKVIYEVIPGEVEYEITIEHDVEEDNVKSSITIEYKPDGSTYWVPVVYPKCDINVLPYIWYHQIYGHWFQVNIDINERDDSPQNLMYFILKDLMFKQDKVWKKIANEYPFE